MHLTRAAEHRSRRVGHVAACEPERSSQCICRHSSDTRHSWRDPGTQSPSGRTSGGIHKIKHVVVIMQENRSFDHYFGTFPGANGIPMQNGVPTACLAEAPDKPCIRPYHDPDFVDSGGPHHFADAIADIDGGKMDGFIDQALKGQRPGLHGSADRTVRRGTVPDVRATRQPRDPQLLDLRAGVRAAGRDVRTERLVEPAGASLHRLGLVSEVHRGG